MWNRWRCINISHYFPILQLESPWKIMEISSNEIKKLFTRLQEASKQAAALNREVADIKKEIQLMTELDIFKEYLRNNGETSNEIQRTECDGSPLAKKRCNLNTADDYVVVYTDGACENNGKSNAKAGIGVWFGENHPLNISKPVNGRPTNNTAEIQACIEAINVAKSNGIDKLKIITDSQFTINCITKWIHKWKKNNWRLAGGGDVKNKTDLEVLDKLCQQIQVRWEHVPGHKGYRGNEEADRLAREGALRYR